MASLAKGLAVLAAFGPTRPSMSLTEAAGVAGLSRAAARRVLCLARVRRLWLMCRRCRVGWPATTADRLLPGSASGAW